MSRTAFPKHLPENVAVPARSHRSRRPWQRALTLAFLAALLAPALDLIFRLDPNPSPLQQEVSFPSLHLDRSLLQFPRSVIQYVKVNMGFRGALVRARGLFAWHVLRTSPAPDTVIRADPWLFFRGERVLDDFRRTVPFSASELEQWRAVLEARRAWLEAGGIRYLVVIMPNKETVYAEAVPPWFSRASGPSRLMQLAQTLADTRVELLDLSAVVESHKVDGRLYRLTDTHWNDQGAFLGYRAIAERLRPWFPGLRVLGQNDVVQQGRIIAGGDLARQAGMSQDLFEPDQRLRFSPAIAPGRFADGSPVTFEPMDLRVRHQFDTSASSGEVPSAVLIRDSFCEALLPYLSRHFQTATWIWTYDFPADLIAARRPAVVIEQLIERQLMVLTPTNPALVGTPAP